MDITFLIGNGFDVNLGLETKYSDFYKAYNPLGKNDLISTGLRNKNFSYWADFEAGLGKFTEEIKGDNDVEDYLSSKISIEAALSQYLKNEEARFSIPDKIAFSREFQNRLQKMTSEFDAESQDFFASQVFGRTDTAMSYRFVTFNYTNCLDQMVSAVLEDSAHHLLSHHYRASIIVDRPCLPLHVHGDCDENMIVGVGDVSQIANESLRADPALLSCLVKKETNRGLGNKRISNVETMINDSQVVLLYGLSIGETDVYWWRYLVNWLKSSDLRRLVIYSFDPNGVSLSASGSLLKKRKVISCILKAGGEKETGSNPLSNHIIVVNNGKIFSFGKMVVIADKKDPFRDELFVGQ